MLAFPQTDLLLVSGRRRSRQPASLRGGAGLGASEGDAWWHDGVAPLPGMLRDTRTELRMSARTSVRVKVTKDGRERICLPNHGCRRPSAWSHARRRPRHALGLSLASGVTAMSTSDHWLIQRRSNFEINEKIPLLMQPWLGRVVGGLGGAGG
jgi:hypothetical protein